MILLVSFLVSYDFETEIGKCSLMLYENSNINKLELELLIKEKSKEIVAKYGSVNKKPYFIYITKNLDQFHKIAKGSVPEWGIGIAKKNPDRAIIKSPQMSNITNRRMKQIIIAEIIRTAYLKL